MAGPKQRDDESFSAKEAQERFQAAIKAGLNTPPKPLKDKPRVRKAPPKKAKSKKR